ncbi:hypothetical protein FOZ63_030274 [Perkinsus olseni]|uniref:Uncharacterized protein n=1 Tax=Perkinsus olseni TaxID=32597 RepID=A0A7J6QZ20_PEROL|nr:hypothetical protein FOZ62_001905 [Perkinsus olseni]KAF4759315.1 hypothetical protein FOZ63_030274 [Perkinsus olseni]
MRYILASAICSSIVVSVSGRLQGQTLGEMIAHYDDRRRRDIMMKDKALRGKLIRDVGGRMRGHKYLTPPGHTINGESLMAELTLFDSPEKAHLKFWGAENTVSGMGPLAHFSLSLHIQPSIHQVVNSEDSLPLGESIEIKVTPDLEKRSQVIKTFNKQFGDFFTAWKDDFKRVFFTPSRDGMGHDYISLPIGGKQFRMFFEG